MIWDQIWTTFFGSFLGYFVAMWVYEKLIKKGTQFTNESLLADGWVVSEYYAPLNCQVYKKGDKQVVISGDVLLPFNDKRVGSGTDPLRTGVIRTWKGLEKYYEY